MNNITQIYIYRIREKSNNNKKQIQVFVVHETNNKTCQIYRFCNLNIFMNE